ncbi:MAG TPA: hypothetical protein VLG10_07890 [Methylomirabilota bacterium]|nr:hypothetical protein [Methylomirabilota bacterium]
MKRQLDGILAEFPSVIGATECALEIPIWRHLYRELAKAHTLIRHDVRGNGLSDRTVLSRVSVPTLVMHARADARVPFAAGRRMAAGIRGPGSSRCRGAITCSSITARSAR